MENVERVAGCSAVKPIVYGNTAERLPHKTAQEHTHKWKLFVRPYCEEDISKYVKKVQFRLHDSYTNAVRTVETPPFEVEETGWGEFEANIKIYFVDPNEKPVNATYYLRLFVPLVTMSDGKQIVLYEHYDEIPTKMMMKALEEASKDKPMKSLTDFQQQKSVLVEKLTNAVKEITSEITELKENLRQNCLQDNKTMDGSRATSVDGSVDSSMDH
ncbi:unnamed protein product [Bursaphelenchus okinawaensis]|uniref:YEATS domain-containing protein n=1 Tax=Bursaphelenchus okinawaensis TaxID=465554 RepID=A0A811KVD4_9BILA|nr:unnamed protein product [Bursaphelenchus okinawaensis]CAG9112423.1 unnamed protein product [Bursaphelenchus okinawaensis]